MRWTLLGLFLCLTRGSEGSALIIGPHANQLPRKGEVTQNPPRAPIFHDYEVLGSVAVSGPDWKRMAQSLVSDIRASDGSYAMCFDPRHGLKYDFDGHHYELVICFECSQYLCYKDRAVQPMAGTFGGGGEASSLFRRAVAKRGLKAPDH